MTDQTREVIDLAPTRGWVTTAVLSALWDVHPRKVQRMTVDGTLPIHYIQLGREYRYPLAELNRYLVDHGGQALTDADIDALETKAAERWGVGPAAKAS